VVLPCPDSGYVWHPKFNFDTVPPLPVPAWLGDKCAIRAKQCRSLAPGPAFRRMRWG